jgi:16S rRNA (guanine(527)-N(7))-methyltransferase RsmG
MEPIKEWFERNRDFLPAIDSRECALYECFHGLLADWNARMALVSRKSFALAYSIHFADSLFISDLSHSYARGNVYDLGTGAGFPGICFAIRYPNNKVLLFERSEKKRRFLSAALEELKLPNLSIESELADKKYVGLFFARAVMPREELLPFLWPRLSEGSFLVTCVGGEKKDLPVSSGFLKIEEKEYTLPTDQGSRRIEILRKVPRGTK